MRAFFLVAATACVSAPAPQHPVQRFDLDATSMVPLVIDASHAHGYKVALIEPTETDARIVVDRGDAALEIQLAAGPSWRDHFATCLGSCSTAVSVVSVSGPPSSDAQALLDDIASRVQTNRVLLR